MGPEIQLGLAALAQLVSLIKVLHDNAQQTDEWDAATEKAFDDNLAAAMKGDLPQWKKDADPS